MSIQPLPPDCVGDWIWLQDHERKENRKVFARKEFVLKDFSGFAELKIAALPFYHVYINGEHVGYGPAAPTHTYCYVDSYDVTSCLTNGINTVAIICVDQKYSSWFAHPYPPKIWCMLSVDGVPVLTTGKDWKISECLSYYKFQPRNHTGLESVEKVNLDSFISDWMQSGYDDRHWDPAHAIIGVAEGIPTPMLSGVRPHFWSESEAFDVIASGTFSEEYACTFYSYSGIRKFKPGNYAAESYALVQTPMDVKILVSSDDPFVIFCNEDPVFFNNQSRNLDPFEMPHSPRRGDEILHTTEIHLKKGWNRILCFQDAGEDSMGMMILFPDVPKHDIIFRRECNNEALSGWHISGPLRLPFSFSSAAFSMGNRPEPIGFLPIKDHINDMSAYLTTCQFSSYGDTLESGSLREGEFAVYDLATYYYGFPLLDIDGQDGDVVDITCGLRLTGNSVCSIGPLGRMTDTLHLRDGNNTWLRLTPRMARYVMISVRRATRAVTPILRFVSASTELGADNEFFCSEEIYNTVWQNALASLRHCVGQNIIDDPCGRRCQAFPEAYVYARTLYYLFEGRDVVEKALQEFAASQLENGMLLKIAPSGIHSYSPDAALLWIIWLEDHWIHTGDLNFIRQLQPCLMNIVRFFRIIPPEQDILLPSERAGHCFFLNDKRHLQENGIFTPLNALYCKAMQSAAKLFALLEENDYFENCQYVADRLVRDMQEYCYNPEIGLFADCFVDGKCSESASFRSNIAALYAGIVPNRTEAERILDICLADRESLMESVHTPFVMIVMETLSKYGRQSQALELIKEGFAETCKFDFYEQKCNPHVFSIVAADFIIRELVGVRPSAPGYSQIYFNPACDTIHSAHFRLACGSDKITVDWKVDDGQELQVAIDSSNTLDVLPVIPSGYGASFDLGNYTNLLDPNAEIEEPGRFDE